MQTFELMVYLRGEKDGITEWRRMLSHITRAVSVEVANKTSNNIIFGGSFSKGGSCDYFYYHHYVYEV